MPNRKGIKEELLFSVGLIVLTLMAVVLAVFLIRAGGSHQRVIIEYEAEKAASRLLESFRDQQLKEALQANPAIKGFGIYGFSGALLYSAGSAPPFLRMEMDPMRGRQFNYLSERGSVVLIRAVGFRPMGPPRGFMGQPMPRPPDMPALLWLELDIRSYYRGRRMLGLAGIALPLFVIVMAASFLLIFRKNLKYRRQMAAQEQLVHLGEAARTLTHEIRNPLSAIRIQVGTLRRILPGDPQGALAVMEEEVDRLAHLTDRIGEFLRDPGGRPEPLDLNTFLTDLVKRYDGRVVFRSAVQGQLSVVFDRERLRSVLENLLRNALESQEAAGPAGEPVGIELSRRAHGILLEILDRGTGIPPQTASRLFEPFFTTKTRGSGLGLFIARRFLEARGASLRLEAREGGGTRVTVTLASERHENPDRR